tara:strand:+ start:601 stop:1071 length:471 start_codon:yes stop_codon:yes gene_type:complete
MTSTVSAATLTVQVKETINLHGYDHGSNNVLTIENIGEVQKRIVTVPTSEKEIVAISTTTVGAGMFVEADVRYIRITNLDDTNHIVLTFKNEGDSEFAVMLDKGESFIYNADLSAGVVDTMDASATALTVSLDCLVNIMAIADTAACDCEIFVASV